MDRSDVVQQIRDARRVSTPLVAIETTDPTATLAELVDRLGNGTEPPPMIQWDAVQGIRSLNEPGHEVLKRLGVLADDNTKGNPLALFEVAAKLPDKTLLAVHAAGRWLDPLTVQAIWNLRDQYKSNHRMLILLGHSITLPPELAGDVLMFEEPLPDGDALRVILHELHESADLPFPDSAEGLETIENAVAALSGLSAFSAEQVAAMSLTKDGLDVDACWDQKRKQIDRTPALRVYRDVETFDQVGGVSVIKDFLSRIMAGRRRPRAVVFIDEIEKVMAGAGGDTSGVSQDQLGTLLTYMQDHGAAGCIFVGPPGSAKSMVAKAAGAAGGVPTIQLDLGAAKGSLVGQSEQQLRSALKVISAVSEDSALWLATCNSIKDMPPELRRRFTLGTYFFDLPTAKERLAIWKIHLERFGLKARQYELPADAEWTGAEVRQCCDLADRLDMSLIDASQYVIPVAKSAVDRIESLRNLADGRLLSASTPGVYARKSPHTAAKPKRRMAPAAA